MDIRVCLPCGYAGPPPDVECPHCGTELVVRDERWLVGQVLGNYRIERILGSGGMGVVFGARHEALLREAAIKVLQPDLGSNDDTGSAEAFARRFLQEARLLAALEHPGIVGIYDFSVSTFGFPYLVMPLLHGETLRELLRRHPQGLPQAWIAAIVQDLSAALDYAHAQGVVHRDLKPENIFLGTDGERSWTKLLDFGIAHSQDHGRLEHTMTGTLVGTPLYLAPEQLRGEPVSAATDQYSLALLVIELLNGRAVRAGQNLTLITHRYADAPLPETSLPKGLDPSQSQALVRATDPQPDARFASAHQFSTELTLPDPERVALAAALEDSTPALPQSPPTTAMTTPPPMVPPSTPTVNLPPPPIANAKNRKPNHRNWLVAALLLLAALTIGFWLLRPNAAKPLSQSSTTGTAIPTSTEVQSGCVCWIQPSCPGRTNPGWTIPVSDAGTQVDTV